MFVQEEKYINPLTDFGFKKLFGSEPNKDLLIDFLNQLLPNHTIKELTYGSNEHRGRSESDRKAIFDIYCVGEKCVSATLNTLLNQHCEVFYDKLHFVYIELPKFNKQAHELETRFDKWLYVFTHLWKLQERPPALQERIFKKLFEVAEIAKFSSKERKAYQDSLKAFWDINSIVDTAKEEARAEALEEGREERAIEIARAMKSSGEPFEKIAKFTGLSIEEIEQL